MFNKLYYGAAYYPELWDQDKEVIQDDICHMREIGINVVRMGEFAWSRMEPEEDRISPGFFVSMIDLLYRNGIETVMCTPTPTPPIWLSHAHPERMFVNADGEVMCHGARQHMCTNNPYFRERSGMIVEALAQAVAGHPGVVAWQTDNEFKCHVAECFCLSCKEQWHEWLRCKYGTIERLNEAWGTQIWSEDYRSFDQVPQPFKTTFVHNTSLSTAYKVFSQEKIAEYQQMQISLIRKHSAAPITHNTNLNFNLDNELMFKNLDFAAFDDYPDCDHYREMLMNYDLFRNTKRDKPFWVMETCPAHNGYTHLYRKAHRNGFLVAEAAAAYALGAKGFSYWLWRQQRSGVEQVHGSILSAWGQPTIGYRNALAASQARKKMEPVILETRPVQADVAIVYSDRARTFLLTEPYENLSYLELVRNFYNIVLDMGIHRDLIFEGASWDHYKLVMTPFMPCLTPELLEQAQSFVRQGGIWIVGPLSGGRTEEHTVPTNAALGDLEKMIPGLKTLFTYPMGGTEAVGQAFGMQAPLGLWSAIFEAEETKVIGTIEGGLTPGKAFMTEHPLGDGKIVMLGSLPLGESGNQMLGKMMDHYAREAGVIQKTDVTSGTIVAPRIGEDDRIVWVIVNMNGCGGQVTLPGEAEDLIGKTEVLSGVLRVGPYQYRLVKLKE